MMFNFSIILDNAHLLVHGLLYGVQISVVAITAGFLLGTVLALMSISKSRFLRLFSKIYINFFRSIPLIQIMLAFYIILPFLIKLFTGHFSPIDASQSACYSFALFESAYFSEIIRTGIQAIPRGQMMASRSLGFNYLQTMYHIILPQAYRTVFPIMMTQVFIIFQDVSLVYAVGAIDFFGAADQVAQREFCPVEMYIFAAVVYFLICYFLSHLFHYLEKHLNRYR